MTNYTELANRIVGHGVGWKTLEPNSVTKGRLYRFTDEWTGKNAWLTTSEFVRDGRVVLAMMEKCRGLTIESIPDHPIWWVAARPKAAKELRANNEYLAIAILIACCDALDEQK